MVFFVFLVANCPVPFHASILLLFGFYGVSFSLFILHRSLERDRYCIIQVASSLSPKRRISLGALGEGKKGWVRGLCIVHGGGKVEGWREGGMEGSMTLRLCITWFLYRTSSICVCMYGCTFRDHPMQCALRIEASSCRWTICLHVYVCMYACMYTWAHVGTRYPAQHSTTRSTTG